MSPRCTLGIVLVAAMLLGICAPAPALAAGRHAPLVAGDVLGIGGLVSGVFSSVGHAVLGAFSWTVGLAGQFILVTIGALVRLLIPHSWVHAGVQIMRWIVAVPDYAGQVTTPTGHHGYGFAGINDLRDVFAWLGIAIAPLTLVYATTRAMIGDGDPIAIPVLRIAAATIAIASYPYWWTQAAAACDQMTNVILSVPAVSAGLYRLMDYAVAGVALGGWQLIDLGLMAATALALLALIFLKVVLILLGALLYATGPVMIGLVPTRAGAALARAWASAAAMLLGLGIAWATVFAVGALLIGDSTTAGPLIAGNTTFGSLVGGLLLAVAGVASLWVCLKVAREAGAILRMQLSGLLVFAGAGAGSGSGSGSGGSGSAPGRARTTGASLRSYAQRLTAAVGAAGGEMAVAGPAGARLAAAARAGGLVGRRGLVGTAMAAAGAGAGKAAPRAGRMMQRSRAGAVAVRMARAGTAGWTATQPATQGPREGTSARPTPDGASSRSGSVGRPNSPRVSTPPAAGRETADHGQPGAPPARPRARAGTRGESRPGDRDHPAATARPALRGADSGNATAPARPVTPPPAPQAPVAPGPSNSLPVAASPRRAARDAKASTPPQAPRPRPSRGDGEGRE
jgi:hypothetical protein